MQNHLRRIEIFVIVVIIGFIGIIYAFKQSPKQVSMLDGGQQQPETQNITEASDDTNPQLKSLVLDVPATSITYSGENGQSAMDLLAASHKVEVKHYSFGDFVTSIDGIVPDANHFWALYINGSQSQVAASVYITKSGDQVKWQIDEVQ